MDAKSTISNTTEKKKPGPKPKEAFDAKAELQEVRDLLAESRRLTEEVRADLVNMKNCLAKMAHMSGNERVLDEFGIDRWEVTKDSMRKNRG